MKEIESGYDTFASTVSAIKAGESSAQYVGSGAESNVWFVDIGDEAYAVKLMREFSARGKKRDTAGAAREKLEAGMRGLGIPGLEQICAASLEEGAVVYRYITRSCLDPYEVSDEQIAALINSVEQATAAGIEIDGWNTSGGNTLYNDVDGFTLIDYWAARREVSFRDNMTRVLRPLGSRGMVLARRADIEINRER